jgi:signal transduction histidine kinase
VDLLEGSVLLTLRDAETRRQLRSQLDISTRLAAISKLTSGVAHEIKNPLNAMALHLEILRSKLEREETVDREVGVIGGEIARLDRVVKTFLDFTRPVELNWEDVDLAAIAHQVAGLVGPEASLAGIAIRVDAPVPAPIRGDSDLLKQAALNVVNNAIEAMANGGTLQIAVSRERGGAVLEIRDQGPGIPADIRDRIFNLYFTTKPRGSGIGLAMTFRIVQLHNGAIDLESEERAGSTFRLRFPEGDPSVTAIRPIEGAA